MEAAASYLLDFSKPFDVVLLDQIAVISMDGSHPQRPRANEFLVMMKDNPEMWKRSDAILETSKIEASKFFALQVLSEMINTRWKVIPQDQRLGIRNYVVSKIISIAASDETSRQQCTILSRLNLVLVEILKQDWPHNWPTFIADIIGSSKSSESLCENNMRILRLLSEEVFDFSMGSMTSVKMRSMKESLNHEFSQIFQLCEFILGAATKESLLLATLQTLQRFLTWIPLGYIFETPLLSVLITKFFPQTPFRPVAIDCLTEISSLPPAEVPANYTPGMQGLLVHFIQQLAFIVPPGGNISTAYEEGSDDDQLFVQRLALLLSTYLRSYFPLFNQPDGNLAHEDTVLAALVYMIRVSEVEDEEVFKTCLEFWHHFSKELHNAATGITSGSTAGNASFGMNSFGQFSNLNVGSSGRGTNAHILLRLELLSNILHMLRVVIIDHMAKPEEVLIVEDENGEIVREMTKDTEVIAQYKTMRETIVYLTHLNYEDTEGIMLEKLEQQVSEGMFTWNGLNTLCWAIGSISGAMGELDEKRFLVSVIKDLLRLCEDQRGKDNKAVVASNIMYIVGQYPRFLRNHWKFLKTVVNKLFEFMHEYHPGVQDMACDTFLKISQKCKRKFMTPQIDDPQPFILTLIHELTRHVSDLQPHQVLSFYESVGTMISDNGPVIRLPRESLIVSLMESTNNNWVSLMNDGAKNVNVLLQVEAVREVSRIIKINTKVCSSAGSIFVHQLSNIFLDVLKVYQLFSEQIKTACGQQGVIAVRLVLYKAMRSAKSDILEMFTAFFGVCKDLESGVESIIPVMLPPILNDILTDYSTSPAAARDAKVLSLLSVIVAVFRDNMAPELPRILDSVFQPTLEMITTNMLDHPEHRINFFHFLRESNNHCFFGLFNIPVAQQKLLVDSIVWAFKHTERNISETGLEILQELLINIAPNPQIAQPFYQSFLLSLIQDIMAVMTDRLHKSGFKIQAGLLMHIFHQVQTGQVTVPLDSSGAFPDNSQFLKEHVAGLLLTAFPNLTRSQVIAFIIGLFDVSKDLTSFKQHLRDFLITIKEFSSEDNADLYAEEADAQRELEKRETQLYRSKVPGLLSPDELELESGLDHEQADLDE